MNSLVKKKGKWVPTHRIAGMTPRLLALISDLSLATILMFYLRSYPLFREIFRDLLLLAKEIPFLRSETWALYEYTGTLVALYVVHIFLRFYGTLLFGVSLSQFVLGMRGGTNLLWDRVGGALRVVLEFFMAPFVVFDIPCFFRKTTIKEELSLTKVVRKVRHLGKFNVLWYVPLTVFVALFSPMLENLDLIDGIHVSFSKEKAKPLSHQSDFKSFKNYHSNYFHFSSFSNLEENRYLLLPSFEVVKKGAMKKITPYVVAYDRKKQVEVHFKVLHRFSLLEKILEARIEDPLFERSFPLLAVLNLENVKKFEPLQDRISADKPTVFSERLKKEVESLVETSFELSLPSLLPHVFQHGPFITGYLNFRNFFLQFTEKGDIPHVDLVQIGNHRFLRLRQNLPEEDEGDLGLRETLIPIWTNNSLVFQLVGRNGPYTLESKNTFKKTFLNATEWFFDYVQNYKVTGEKKEMTPLSIIDAFTQNQIPQSIRDKFEEYLFHYYFDLASQAIKSGDKILKELLIAQLNRYYLVAEYKNKIVADYYSLAFFEHLKTLKVSLVNEDVKYFGL